jgi:hypothetical protein
MKHVTPSHSIASSLEKQKLSFGGDQQKMRILNKASPTNSKDSSKRIKFQSGGSNSSGENLTFNLSGLASK